MGVVPRLDGALDMDRGNIGAGKGAIVHDLFNAGAGGRDFCGEIREATGPITDDRSETREPAIGDEAAFDDAAQNIGIDVAAAKQQHDPFACEFWKLPGKTCGERRRS